MPLRSAMTPRTAVARLRSIRRLGRSLWGLRVDGERGSDDGEGRESAGDRPGLPTPPPLAVSCHLRYGDKLSRWPAGCELCAEPRWRGCGELPTCELSGRGEAGSGDDGGVGLGRGPDVAAGATWM